MNRRLTAAMVMLPLYLGSGARAADAEIDWGALMSANVKTDDNGTTTIDYVPALRVLDRKHATIHGWITPINLGDGATITSFLLTGTPGTCPFCLGIGPEGFVLVSAAEPVPVDVNAELFLGGSFELTPHDPIGFYYRLRDAVVLHDPR